MGASVGGLETLKRFFARMPTDSGMVIVQDPDSIRYNGMPLSTIGTGLVDFVLPVEGCPQALLKHIRHPSLETCKEELQSTNEGTTMVNAELQNKGDEFSKASADMDKLLAASEIASIFLDIHEKPYARATTEPDLAWQTEG